MKPREFEVTIAPDGSVEVHVHGFKGPACLEVAKWFEQVVGKTESQQLTSEFYDPEQNVRYNIDQRH